jgi:hypothetical protein
MTERQIIDAVFKDDPPTLRAWRCLVKRTNIPHVEIARKKYFYLDAVTEHLKESD